MMTPLSSPAVCRRPRVFFAVLLALLAMPAGPAGAQVVPVGGIARNFTVTNRANNQPLQLSAFAGKILVLDFFAYWCGPCQTSSPDVETKIQQYYEALGGNPYGVPVQVLGVNTESTNPTATNNFIAAAGLELVANDYGAASGAWSQFNVTGGIPLFVIINCVAGSPSHSQWQVLYKQSGYAGATTLRNVINSVQVAATPEISVEQPAGTALVDGSSSVAFGSVSVGNSSGNLSFTIRNSGSGILSGVAVSKDGSHPADFTLVSSPATSVAANGGTTTFTVKFNPTGVGTRSAVIHIASNDADENPFDITLRGTGFASATSQEIAVEQPVGSNLTDGGSRDLGGVALGTSSNSTFTIINVGGASLTGLAVSRVGSHAGDFIPGALSQTTLAPGASATFPVTFAPTAPGTRRASLRIASNDADENPFDIFISGVGLLINSNVTTIPSSGNASPYPSTIAVSGIFGPATALRVQLSGLTHTSCDDLDVFLVSPSGQVCALMSDAGGGNPLNQVNLLFDDAAVAVIPYNSAVTAGTWRPANHEPGEAMPPGGSGAIGTSLQALAEGTLNGSWKLYVSDDSPGDSGSLASWSLSFDLTTPEIVVEQPAGTPLSHGSSTVAFGNVRVGSPSSPVTFTVRNTGLASLTGLAISKDGPNSGEFFLTIPGSTTLTPNTHTTFGVTFIPTAIGPRSAVIHIASNDEDESPFDIVLTGTGWLSSIESWRLTHFGSTANSGAGADLHDFDRDGIPNLVEFAFGLDPKYNSAGQLPQAQRSASHLTLSFTQPADVSGITYGAEWSPSLLPGSWTPVADTGIPPQHTFSMPVSGRPKLYLRFKISAP